MEKMEATNMEAFIEKMNRIYEERDAEFEKMELAYQRKYESIQKMILEMSEDKKQMDVEKGEIKEEQDRLRQQETVIRQQWAALEKEKADLERREKELVYKNNLELEKHRNEEMKLKRLREEYEYKISLADCGLSEIEEEAEVDPERYLLRTEHEEIIHKLQTAHTAEIENLQEQYEKMKGRLQAEVEGLRKERMDLLKKNLELSGTLPPESVPIPVEDDLPEEIESDAEMIEELTAEVLKSHIEKNNARLSNLKIYHSDEGEQLSAESRGLRIRFLFSEPPRFDIVAKRKKSGTLQKKLTEMNQRNPGIKFQYEDGEVCATGYFLSDMSAEQLIDKVEQVMECFKTE